MSVRSHRYHFAAYGVLFLFVALWVPTIHGQEGDRIAERFLNNVVQLTTTLSDGSVEHGFGFVVGERGETLFVVTANHVVRTDDPDITTKQIQARFAADRGKAHDALLLDLAFGSLDLALLEISKPFRDYTWESRYMFSTPVRGDRVWFIGRNQDWWWPTDSKAGEIEDAPLLGNLPVSIDSVLPGTSGAPMFTQEGIVGMIIEDSPEHVVVLDIGIIRQIVAERWGSPWGLQQYQTSAPLLASTPSIYPSSSSLTKIVLRSEPLTFDGAEVESMLKLDEAWIPTTFLANDFSSLDQTVIDRITDLMWQQAGSEDEMTYDGAQQYIARLNQEQFAGYDDWRLPTTEELISLMEPLPLNENLYIDAIFSPRQPWCWSSDRDPQGDIWIIDFSHLDGGIYHDTVVDNTMYVRAVRSLHSR